MGHYVSLDNIFRVCWDHQIYGLCWNNRNRLVPESTGYGQLVHPVGYLGHGGQGNSGIVPYTNGDRHGLIAGLILMEVMHADMLCRSDENSHPVTRNDTLPVVAHILDARIRIFRDDRGR